MDARLRRLERDAPYDPRARFSLHAWVDRFAWPEGPPLSEAVDAEVERLDARIEALLEPVNGERMSYRVEPSDVSNALAALDELPEVQGVRSRWILGTQAGRLYAKSRARAAHTAVLIAAAGARVAIGATRVSPDPAAGGTFFCFTREDPRGVHGYVGQFVFPSSPAAVVSEWVERASSCVRVSREAVERWARRRCWPLGMSAQPTDDT